MVTDKVLERTDRMDMTMQEQWIYKNEKVKSEIWKLATWNVRGLNGKEQELCYEFDKTNLDIMTVTETKKKDNGRKYYKKGIYSYIAE
jgi:hypothetical protein